MPTLSSRRLDLTARSGHSFDGWLRRATAARGRSRGAHQVRHLVSGRRPALVRRGHSERRVGRPSRAWSQCTRLLPPCIRIALAAERSRQRDGPRGCRRGVARTARPPADHRRVSSDGGFAVAGGACRRAALSRGYAPADSGPASAVRATRSRTMPTVEAARSPCRPVVS